jgi:biopolymer transport protein ExbD
VINKSFVDVLFIMLLGAMVALTGAVQLGAVDTAVARLGPAGIALVSAADVQVVMVAEEHLKWKELDLDSAAALAARLQRTKAVLLVTAGADIRHHRVLEVWSDLTNSGFDVKLGARPRLPQGD